MTIRTIIDQILAYHPDIGSQRTCDIVIGSNPDVECTGILITIAPTIEIIRKAIDSGANFIFVHEPTFYSGYDDESDWLAGNDVYEEKLKWITDHGIVIFATTITCTPTNLMPFSIMYSNNWAGASTRFQVTDWTIYSGYLKRHWGFGQTGQAGSRP
jgi:hypothetical protein